MNTYEKHRGEGLLWLTRLRLGPRLASFTFPISILSIFIVFKPLRTLLPHGTRANLLLSMHYALFSIARGGRGTPHQKALDLFATASALLRGLRKEGARRQRSRALGALALPEWKWRRPAFGPACAQT